MSSVRKNNARRQLNVLADQREQLFNEGAIGPITDIQVSAERIVSLRGIMLDIDLPLLCQGPLLPNVSNDADRFHNEVLSVWLRRDPVLANAEVRATGTGVHVLLTIQPCIQFETDAERMQWAAIVQVVQAALPVDPDQPGITATTRAIGSVNSKNGNVVRQLAAGHPVSPEQVMDLVGRMGKAPFATVFGIMVGGDSISPCPFCKAKDTTLEALSHIGKCYGSCGKVSLQKLYELALLPRTSPKGGA